MCVDGGRVARVVYLGCWLRTGHIWSEKFAMAVSKRSGVEIITLTCA